MCPSNTYELSDVCTACPPDNICGGGKVFLVPPPKVSASSTGKVEMKIRMTVQQVDTTQMVKLQANVGKFFGSQTVVIFNEWVTAQPSPTRRQGMMSTTVRATMPVEQRAWAETRVRVDIVSFLELVGYTVSIFLFDSVCAPGHEGPIDKCVPCGKGLFKKDSGVDLCQKCPGNSTTIGLGSDRCLCNAGHTGSPFPGCIACEAGFYKASLGTELCTKCPLNQVPTEGAFACQLVLPGGNADGSDGGFKPEHVWAPVLSAFVLVCGVIAVRVHTVRSKEAEKRASTKGSRSGSGKGSDYTSSAVGRLRRSGHEGDGQDSDFDAVDSSGEQGDIEMQVPRRSTFKLGQLMDTDGTVVSRRSSTSNSLYL